MTFLTDLCDSRATQALWNQFIILSPFSMQIAGSGSLKNRNRCLENLDAAESCQELQATMLDKDFSFMLTFLLLKSYSKAIQDRCRRNRER